MKKRTDQETALGIQKAKKEKQKEISQRTAALEVEPEAPVKKRRGRRTKAEMEAERAAKAEAAALKTAEEKKPARRGRKPKEETAAAAITEKAAPVKKGGRRSASKEKTQETFFEVNGNQVQVSVEDVVAKIHAAYKAEGHRPGNIKNLKIYFNLNELRAYYVIDDKPENKFVEL